MFVLSFETSSWFLGRTNPARRPWYSAKEMEERKKSTRVDIPERLSKGQIRGGRWSTHGQRAALSILLDVSIYVLVYNGVKPGCRSVPALVQKISKTSDNKASSNLGLSTLSGDGFTLAMILKEESPCGSEEASWRWTIFVFGIKGENGVCLKHRGTIHASAPSCVKPSMTMSADGMLLLFTSNGHRSSELYCAVSGTLLLKTTTDHDLYRAGAEKPQYSALAFEMDNRLIEVRPHYGDVSYDTYNQDDLKRKLSALGPAKKFPTCLRPLVVHREVPMWVIWMKELGNFWTTLTS